MEDGNESEDELYDVKERVENLQDDLCDMWALLLKLTGADDNFLLLLFNFEALQSLD